MADTTNYTDSQRLTAKDVCDLMLTISERTAHRYLKDIKDHFSIRVVLYKHYREYFRA